MKLMAWKLGGTFQTFSSISNSIFVPSINVSMDRSKRIGSLVDPDFGNQLCAWADMHLPRRYWHRHIIPVLTLQLPGCPVKQLRHTFSHNSNGVVLFPRIDLQQTPLSKLKVLMDDIFFIHYGVSNLVDICAVIYLLNTPPVKAHEGITPCPDIPYAQLSSNPGQYYDTERWPSLPTISCSPTEMGDVKTILMSAYLKNTSCEGAPDPFKFRHASTDLPPAPND